MQGVRHFLLAVQFFTRIPVTGRCAAWVGYSPAMLRASAAHFPGVGWLVAAVAAAVYAALQVTLGAQPYAVLVCAALSTAATVLATGGFHEDGLADVADGLGGSAQRERALEIMKDSRVGAFGAIALVLALAGKLSLLALLGSRGLGTALCAIAGAHVVSRFWPLLLVRTLGHVGDSATSKSKPLADRISGAALAVAAGWSVPAVALVGGLQGAAVAGLALCASAVAAGVMRAWFARRLQGFTGDCLGATQQVCEIAFYLGMAMALGGPA
ncbi:adenosylcobinamide-GDP ribazoletransferase [Acidovorax sp. NCPPB 4044]|uniref:adenosylcobinamide-GDP ribazoletransferase n=1 Tax=Acidovorax sp. NCPPB 4044 TaxID=2940490 RepID=UPI002303F295|nr:adenosylcobinamide-GDP ribazoletransferase [Acidovorax sp. NCPPB 4044]MDA8519409.1 adenosylcobinamide-GDP ribazoletransferase [Acidovorax sp. NCPPB 4044]